MGSLGFQHSRQIGVFLSGDEGVFLQVFHQHAESLFLSVLGRRCLEAVCRVCAFQFHFALSAYLFDKVACRLELDTVEVHRAGAYLLLVRHLSAGKCCRKGSYLSQFHIVSVCQIIRQQILQITEQSNDRACLEAGPFGDIIGNVFQVFSACHHDFGI